MLGILKDNDKRPKIGEGIYLLYFAVMIGARAAGLQALWYARLAKPWNHSYGPKEEETIRDHREILAWLERTM